MKLSVTALMSFVKNLKTNAPPGACSHAVLCRELQVVQDKKKVLVGFERLCGQVER